MENAAFEKSIAGYYWARTRGTCPTRPYRPSELARTVLLGVGLGAREHRAAQVCRRIVQLSGTINRVSNGINRELDLVHLTV